MKSIKLVCSLIILITISLHAQENTNSIKEKKVNSNISGITVRDMDNQDISLSDYKDKVLLIVNVASKCGYTKQYKGLQKIYDNYKDRGFEILAFPCNQFGGQEPGSNDEIQEFCSLNYGVTFKLFNKIEVNGDNRSPLYSVLTESSGIDQGEVKWNFEKFLIDKEGNVVNRFRTKTDPESEELISAIEQELKK